MSNPVMTSCKLQSVITVCCVGSIVYEHTCHLHPLSYLGTGKAAPKQLFGEGHVILTLFELTFLN
jgi:hypothetical protein